VGEATRKKDHFTVKVGMLVTNWVILLCFVGYIPPERLRGGYRHRVASSRAAPGGPNDLKAADELWAAGEFGEPTWIRAWQSAQHLV